jgi:hypothetical protein
MKLPQGESEQCLVVVVVVVVVSKETAKVRVG